jgi:hypothetical protein
MSTAGRLCRCREPSGHLSGSAGWTYFLLPRLDSRWGLMQLWGPRKGKNLLLGALQEAVHAYHKI